VRVRVRIDREGISDQSSSMRRIASLHLAAALLLVSACTGGDRLGEPSGSPMQFSTALPDTPVAPRDLCMFDGVNGRVLTWSDLMRLVRRTDVVVMGGEGGPDEGVVRAAVVDDVRAAFSPTAVIDGCTDAEACAQAAADALHDSKRVVVLCPASCDLAEVSRRIRALHWFSSVTTVAMVPSGARALAAAERDRADVVIHTAPERPVRASQASR
jgi:hypothetical protein